MLLGAEAEGIAQAMAALHEHGIGRRVQLVGRRTVDAIEGAGFAVGDVIEVGLGVGFSRCGVRGARCEITLEGRTCA